MSDNMTPLEYLGIKICAHRRHFGYSVSELSDITDISAQIISNIENGDAGLDEYLNNAAKLAVKIGYSGQDMRDDFIASMDLADDAQTEEE